MSAAKSLLSRRTTKCRVDKSGENDKEAQRNNRELSSVIIAAQ